MKDWRDDPVRAAELITGLQWTSKNTGWAQLGDEGRGLWCADWGVNVGWAIYRNADGKEQLCEVSAEDREASIKDASAALVEAVIRGDVALPAGCPGLKALDSHPGTDNDLETDEQIAMRLLRNAGVECDNVADGVENLLDLLDSLRCEMRKAGQDILKMAGG